MNDQAPRLFCRHARQQHEARHIAIWHGVVFVVVVVIIVVVAVVAVAAVAVAVAVAAAAARSSVPPKGT